MGGYDMGDMQRRKLVKAAQVAERMKVSRGTVYRWITEERIQAIKINGIVRIFEDSVARYEQYTNKGGIA